MDGTSVTHRACRRCGLSKPLNGRHFARNHGAFVHNCLGCTNKPPTLPERFWAKVNKAGPVARAELGPCWLWTGCKSTTGYGKFGLGTAADGTDYSHRVSWRLEHGHIDDGAWVLHRCDVRACVNPAHLFLGSVQDNQADMARKGRSAAGERNGAARLLATDVRAIRAMVRAGARRADVAANFGVSVASIDLIVMRRRWCSVA
jgi:hypothetical protein